MSGGGSSTVVSVSPSTRPSYVKNSLVCIKADGVVASSTNFMMLMCPVRCGHCARHSESGSSIVCALELLFGGALRKNDCFFGLFERFSVKTFCCNVTFCVIVFTTMHI